jgi:hypothetical protein
MWICAAVDVFDFANISLFMSGLSRRKQRFKILSALNHYI